MRTHVPNTHNQPRKSHERTHVFSTADSTGLENGLSLGFYKNTKTHTAHFTHTFEHKDTSLYITCTNNKPDKPVHTE